MENSVSFKNNETNDKVADNIHLSSTTEAANKLLTPDTASKAFEEILFKVGDYNSYQWKLWAIAGTCCYFAALHNLGAVYLAATPDHWCNIPYFQERNISGNVFLNITVPWVRGKDASLEPSKCSYNDYDYASSTFQNYFSEKNSSFDPSIIADLPPTHTNSCTSWNYDDSIFKTTVVTEWDLVCSNKWMMSSTQSTFMMGILLGALIASAVSDKYGRRIATLICTCLFLVASISAAFTTSFVLFLILRFIVAGAGQGMMLSNYILVMENLSLRGRTVIGNLFHLSFAIGFVVLSGFAYAVREWRNLQLVLSVPAVVLLSYFWILPESCRWLLMKGKKKEGIEVLRSIAKTNRRPFLSDEDLQPLLTAIAQEVKESKEVLTPWGNIKEGFNSVLSLVRTPNMRRRNLITFYTWFVTSMVYYGLAFSGGNLNASIYATAALSGFVEIPALGCLILLLFKFERKTVLSMSFLLGGIACIAIIFLPSEMVGWNLALATLGKFCLSISFMLVFMFSAELVPTNVRNISIGIASMFARIGSGLAPYIVDLLGEIYYAIPSTIFGGLAIIAGLLSLLLPDTGKKRLPESVEEIETMSR